MLRLFLIWSLLMAGAGFGADAVAPTDGGKAEFNAARSVVYYAQNDEAIRGLEENAVVTARMVNQLLLSVTGKADVATAWRSLIGPKDRIGIKVSAAGGRYFSTHRGVVEAIVKGLEAAGFSREQITVWDRTGLQEAQFVAKPGGYGVRGIAPTVGYDPKAEIVAPVLGRLIWGDLLFRQPKRKLLGTRMTEAEQLSSNSHLATILSQGVTKVINVPVLSDEAGCGVAGAIYNMTVPNLDNWRRFIQRDGSGAQALPEVYADERIGGKVVIHILDGLMGLYAGGPQGNANYAFAHRTLYASKDPVALDATAYRLIEKWRGLANLPPIGSQIEWLATASDMGLGQSAEPSIDLKPVARE